MKTSFALLGLGRGEIILILALVLILWGARHLPNAAKGFREGWEEWLKADDWFRKEVELFKTQGDGREKATLFLFIALIVLTGIGIGVLEFGRRL